MSSDTKNGIRVNTAPVAGQYDAPGERTLEVTAMWGTFNPVGMLVSFRNLPTGGLRVDVHNADPGVQVYVPENVQVNGGMSRAQVQEFLNALYASLALATSMGDIGNLADSINDALALFGAVAPEGWPSVFFGGLPDGWQWGDGRTTMAQLRQKWDGGGRQTA